MKIALVVPGFSSEERDWCIPALFNLARSLAGMNEVHVFAIRYPHRRDRYTISGSTVHSLGGATRRGALSGKLWLETLREIIKECRSSRFDIIHAIWGSESGFLAVIAGKLLRVPSVVSYVGGELVAIPEIGYGAALRPRQRVLNSLVLLQADKLLGGSRQMSEILLDRLPRARARRVETLTLGVDTQLFSPAKSSENQSPRISGSPTILSVGSFIPVKDHANLLRAFAEIEDSFASAKLNLIGTGFMENELRHLASELGLQTQVNFVGALRHEELPPWYHHADLFVQSSRHEVQAMATLEAAACGVPIVGTDVGVLSEFAGRNAAIAVPPQSSAALATAIARGLELRDTLAQRGAELVEREYNLVHVRDRLLRVYNSVAKPRDVVTAANPIAPA